MDFVILDGFDKPSHMKDIIENTLTRYGYTFEYFTLKEMNILPCLSCGSCNERTPGKCILDDEHENVIRSIARCKSLVFLTPIRYGGYSSTLKKMLDRFMTLGTPFYMVKNNLLLHKMRYDIENILTIGEIDTSLESSLKSTQSFKLLSNRNALNMQTNIDTYIFDSKEELSNLKNKFEQFFITSNCILYSKKR